MPIDPYAAVNAIIRAEVVRTGPDEHGVPGAAEREPEPPEPSEGNAPGSRSGSRSGDGL
ncbi:MULTISPECIES: hypothetical protein [unclassified Streptomyces]|uniref:hypothetical protein n=1 Tax=unclassified Streptomyces TaxID=2593676 RepID=UPI0033DE2FAA